MKNISTSYTMVTMKTKFLLYVYLVKYFIMIHIIANMKNVGRWCVGGCGGGGGFESAGWCGGDGGKGGFDKLAGRSVRGRGKGGIKSGSGGAGRGSRSGSFRQGKGRLFARRGGLVQIGSILCRSQKVNGCGSGSGSRSFGRGGRGPGNVDEEAEDNPPRSR
jgi:hypothetical protein